MRRLLEKLGNIVYGIGVVIFSIALAVGIWNGWVVSAWNNPRGFLQIVYLCAALVLGGIGFGRLDDWFSRRLTEPATFVRRCADVVALIAGMAGILAVGIFLFRSIWPGGIA